MLERQHGRFFIRVHAEPRQDGVCHLTTEIFVDDRLISADYRTAPLTGGDCGAAELAEMALAMRFVDPRPGCTLQTTSPGG